MAVKVSEISKELNITIEELKKTAAALDIEVKTSRSSVDEVSAERIRDTIKKLKGIDDGDAGVKHKPKIKAVPIIGKPVPGKPKAPSGKPVVPANFDDRPRKNEDASSVKETVEMTDSNIKEAAKTPGADTENASEVSDVDIAKNSDSLNSESAEKSETVDKPVSGSLKTAADNKKGKAEEKAEYAEEKTAPAEANDSSESVSKSAAEKPKDTNKSGDEDFEKAKKTPPAEDKKTKETATSDKPDTAKAGDDIGDKEKKNKEESEYRNAPNKPMRFKKVFDATKVHEKSEQTPSSRKSGRRDKNADTAARRHRGRANDSGKNEADYSDISERRSHRGAKASQVSAPDMGKPSKGKSKKFFDNKERDKERERHKFEKQENGGGKNSRYFDERSLEKQTRHKKKNKPKPVEPEVTIEELLPEGTVAVTVPITVAGLAEQAEISPTKIIMSLMKLGVMATINQTLDKDAVEMLADDLGLEVAVTEEQPEQEEHGIELHEDAESELQPRAPIITVMGHVDHGKTSLLDAIRNTNVTAGESGGITQHIGASEVNISGKKIVFLDTPGHEAFTTMRARGAQVTDIAVLVVAADDSVKPQTIESISHAKAAGVPIIVAINKIDKPGANPDKVKKDLADNGVLVEDWGGDVISVPVSAKKGEGITDLLEMILLQAEVLELRANPDRLALGTVIEARLDKAKGPIATLLVTNGTLKAGQSVVAGTCSGKIRKMTNFRGESIRKALPATPVEILGLSDVPMAGDAFNAVKNDKVAREIADNRKGKMREEVLARNASTTLEKLFSQIQEGEAKELNLIIKGDVQGSVGAIISSLEKLDNENVRVNVIHSGVGTVTESDVMLAETSGAVIIGFNVRPTTAVTNQAADADVEIRTYRVIYDIIDDVENAMKGMLDPEFKEEILGKAEIRDTFKVPNVGIVGGAYITEGKVQRNAEIRLVRDGIVIHEGSISSLRRFKDDVKEVAQNYECGIGIDNYNDIKPGDIIECFIMAEIKK